MSSGSEAGGRRKAHSDARARQPPGAPQTRRALFAPVRTQLHNRSLHEECWLQRSVPGFCGLTTINGDCAFGSKRLVALARRARRQLERGGAVRPRRCAHCARCDTISVTLQHRDVSWYSRCDLTNLSHHKHVHDIRTARYRRRERTRTCVEAPSRDAWPVTTADALDCDERYMSIVRCGGRRFLFSRREFPGGDLWDSIVRVAVRTAFWAGERDAGPLAQHVAQHRLPVRSQLDAARDRRPAARRRAVCGALAAGIGAARRQRPRCRCGGRPPSLVASGLKAPRAASTLGGPTRCDFDGKVSAALLDGKLVAFTRSNPFPKPVWANASEEERAYEIEPAGGQMASDGGGRHVQVGRRRRRPPPDGDWSRSSAASTS